MLRNDLVVGFFPFKAKQIIDVIIGAYQAGSEKVDIVFEGTDDEYRELESICSGDDYAGKVALYKSSKYLENARDILPDVIDVFKELSPLVSESVSDKSKIQRELEKFSDASNDIIPICVITSWVHSVVDGLNPSIKDYSKKQIDLALALILHEQVLRDAAYNNLLVSFVEIYKTEGGVF